MRTHYDNLHVGEKAPPRIPKNQMPIGQKAKPIDSSKIKTPPKNSKLFEITPWNAFLIFVVLLIPFLFSLRGIVLVVSVFLFYYTLKAAHMKKRLKLALMSLSLAFLFVWLVAGVIVNIPSALDKSQHAHTSGYAAKNALNKQLEYHSKMILRAHPDASTIAESQAFIRWASKNAQRKRIYSEGTATEVIGLLSEYKREALALSSSPAMPTHTHTQPPKPSAPADNTSKTRYPDCVIKPVMRNVDYAACGITPP